MKEIMIEAITNAIDNHYSIRITFEAGIAAITTHFIPEYLEVEYDKITIFSSDDIYVIGMGDVSYDEIEEAYVCSDGESFIIWIFV